MGANYQLTVEDAAEVSGYHAVVCAAAATQGPMPFWFSSINDTAINRVGSTTHKALVDRQFEN
jgi:hypothetical protein